MEHTEEGLVQWAISKGLSEKTVEILKQEDFTSVEDLKTLCPDDVVTIFQQPTRKLLSGKQFVLLKRAIEDLVASLDSGDGLHEEEIVSKEVLDGLVITANEEKGFESETGEFQEKAADDTLRLILIGKAGSGKSSCGNTILGQEAFVSATMFSSVTRECELRRGTVTGARIEILDCPGLLDTTLNEQDVLRQVCMAVALTHPGPHAFLYVIKLGRFTQEDFAAYRRLKKLFDDGVSDYMAVVFTGGDRLEQDGQCLADLLEDAPESLHTVLGECRQRCIVFNNQAADPQPQVGRLLRLLTRMGIENDHTPYVCPRLKAVGDHMKEEVRRKLRDAEEYEQKGQKVDVGQRRGVSRSGYFEELDRLKEAIAINPEQGWLAGILHMISSPLRFFTQK